MGLRAVQSLGSGRLQQKEGWARKVVLSHQRPVWALYPSIESWPLASFLPHTNSTQPRTQAERIGRCPGWQALSALRLNKLTAPLS